MQPNKAYHRHQESLLSNFNGGLGLEEDCGVGGGSSTSGGGSLFSNTISNHFDSIMTNNIYDVLGAEVASVLQTSLSFASSAGMANVNVRLPFTTAQRQELERQTAIYKFMMSSVPVPPQLLVPISNSTTPSNHYTHVKGGSLELGISNSCTDPEPWRCRRTDGKKWRCSRDVIPEQKYCERHSHKCRPRSRKPVELNHQFNNNSTNLPYSKSHFLNHRDRDKNKNNINNHQSSTSISSTGVSVSAASHDQLRCSEWFMKGENFPVLGSNQELQQIMNTKLGLSRNANEYDPNIDIDIQKQQQQQHERVFNLLGDNDQSSLLLVPKLTPFELGIPSTHQTIQETRHFIDAWSIPETERGHHQFGDEVGNRGGCGSSSNEKLPFSSLTLAMCGGNEYETNNNDDNENQNLEMGFGIMGSEGTEQVGIIMKSQSQWLNPVSWMDSTPGGPLAEALCLGIAGSTVEASSRGCNSSGTTSSRSSC